MNFIIEKGEGKWEKPWVPAAISLTGSLGEVLKEPEFAYTG